MLSVLTLDHQGSPLVFYFNNIITSQGIWRIEERQLGQLNAVRWPCSNAIMVISVAFLPVFSLICSNVFSIVALIAYLQLKFLFPLLCLALQFSISQSSFPVVFIVCDCGVKSCEPVLHNLLTFSVVVPSFVPFPVTQG